MSDETGPNFRHIVTEDQLGSESAPHEQALLSALAGQRAEKHGELLRLITGGASAGSDAQATRVVDVPRALPVYKAKRAFVAA